MMHDTLERNPFEPRLSFQLCNIRHPIGANYLSRYRMSGPWSWHANTDTIDALDHPITELCALLRLSSFAAFLMIASSALWHFFYNDPPLQCTLLYHITAVTCLLWVCICFLNFSCWSNVTLRFLKSVIIQLIVLKY